MQNPTYFISSIAVVISKYEKFLNCHRFTLTVQLCWTCSEI